MHIKLLKPLKYFKYLSTFLKNNIKILSHIGNRKWSLTFVFLCSFQFDPLLYYYYLKFINSDKYQIIVTEKKF